MRRSTRAAIAAAAVPGCLAALFVVAPLAHADETSGPTPTVSETTPAPDTDRQVPAGTSAPSTSASASSSATATPSGTSSSPTSTTSPKSTSSTHPPTTTTHSSSSTTPPASSSSTTSSSATGHPTSTPTGSSTTTPGAGDEPILTPDQLAAQIAQAELLRAHLAISNKALAVVIDKLDALAKQSNELLDKLATAREAEATAQATAKDNEDLSARLTVELASERQRLRAWAFYAYSEGGSAAELIGVIDAMGDDPAQASNPMGDLSYLTDARAQTFANIQTLQLQQADATYRAEVSRKASEQASAVVVEAKAAVDMIVAEQQAQLAALRKTQAADLAKAGPLVGILAGSRTPAAVAAYDALLAEMTANGQTIGSVGALCSKDEGTYPNGMLPATALCPLWKAPGESLRPRAAAAFNSLSALYAKQTGHPLCVTDSYRSLGDQYAVKASRGMWAATPGTSPHGLGIALDLCGGINSFGTPAYEWMQQNGPSYGWYHPAWAQPGGSLPEPWHWQFAG